MQTISRRDFLRRSVAGAVGLGVMGLPLKSSASDTLIVPAVVIGSGFGGAVAALRLAQAGVRTVVLERGRRWPIRNDGNTFATFEKPDGRCSWLSDTTPIAFVESAFGLTPATFRRPYTGLVETIQGKRHHHSAGGWRRRRLVALQCDSCGATPECFRTNFPQRNRLR